MKTVTVKAGTGANVKPYTYVGDDNETTGYDVEVLKEVFDRLDGYDLQIEVTDIPFCILWSYKRNLSDRSQ